MSSRVDENQLVLKYTETRRNTVGAQEGRRISLSGAGSNDILSHVYSSFDVVNFEADLTTSDH